MKKKRALAATAVVLTGLLSAGVYASDTEEAEGGRITDAASFSQEEESAAEIIGDGGKGILPAEEGNAFPSDMPDGRDTSLNPEAGGESVLSAMDEAYAASVGSPSPNAFSDYFSYLVGSGCSLGFTMPGMKGVNQVRLDSGILNMQFICASNALKDCFMESVSGMEAEACMDLFERKYGDVIDMTHLEEFHIPDSFDTAEMLETSRKSFEDAYASAVGSDAFASVRNSVGISGIFSAAQNPESIGLGGGLAGKLSGAGELQSLMIDSAGGQESAISGEYSANKAALDARGEKERFDLQSRSARNLMSMVDFGGSVLSPGGGGINVNGGAAGGVLGRLSGMTQTEWKSRQDAQMEEYTRGFEDDVSDAVNIVIDGIHTGAEEHAKVQETYSKSAEKMFDRSIQKYKTGDVRGSILDGMAGSAIVQTMGESGALTFGMH